MDSQGGAKYERGKGGSVGSQGQRPDPAAQEGPYLQWWGPGVYASIIVIVSDSSDSIEKSIID